MGWTDRTPARRLVSRRMARWLLTGGLLAACWLPVSAVEAARVALVIGNGDYRGQGAWRALRNPPADAGAVARVLEDRLGFERVMLERNLNQAGMRRALAEFERHLGPGDTAFFFYSGHGAQVGGENYLIAIDAGAPADAALLRRQNLPVSDLLRVLRDRGAALNVIVLDACRDNPLPANTKGFGPERHFSGKGVERVDLASSGIQSHTLIAYAASENEKAYDGDGALSPYTAALVTELGQPRELEDLFLRVHDRVLNATSDPARFPKPQKPRFTRPDKDRTLLYLAAPGSGPPLPAGWIVLAGLTLSALGLVLWRRGSPRRSPAQVPAFPDAPGPLAGPPCAAPAASAASAGAPASVPRYRLSDPDDPARGFDFPAAIDGQAPGLAIGSGPAVDWRIAFDTVSEYHARVFWRGADWWIEDLRSSNGTQVNGERLAPHQARRLRPGDRVTFADRVMRFDMTAEATEAATRADTSCLPRYRLTDLTNPRRGGFDLPARGIENAVIVIGREPPSDWLIPLDSVSGRHASLFWRTDAWWIQDLGSSNGTRLNGERLEPHGGRRLAPGDRIELGAQALGFECPDTPSRRPRSS